MGEAVRLAKMNLLVNNLRGEIAEVNSFEIDHFNSLGKYDYVMANPPFNVKGIKESTVKNDPRFTAYGLPKPKGGKKEQDKITDANYLWISLFATSLNETGRAGFVMANSASDARNAEYEIRRKMVDGRIIDCMVTIPSNMFYTVTLPATIWFLDKGKRRSARQDKILFIDARNTFRQLDRAHRDWSEEQIRNLAAIVQLYRGEHDRYHGLIADYISRAIAALQEIEPPLVEYRQLYNRLTANLTLYAKESTRKRKPAQIKKLQASGLPEQLAELSSLETITLPASKELTGFGPARLDNTSQRDLVAQLATVVKSHAELAAQLKEKHNTIEDFSMNMEKLRLGELVVFQRGFDITKKEQTDGEVPVISSGGISSYHNTHRVEGPGVVIGRMIQHSG